MLGCYRKGEVADEEVFTRAIIAVLCNFPEEIVRQVTNPARGLPAKLQWLPTIAEVRAACEAAYAPIVKQREAHHRRLQQLHERLAPPEVTAEARARAVARWQETRATMDGEGRGEREAREKAEAEERLALGEQGLLPKIVASPELRRRSQEEAAA